MKCVNHPELDAIIECVRCRRPLCADCRVPSRDGQTAVCRPCLAVMKQRQAQQQGQPQPMQTIVQPPPQPMKQEHMKFCKHCGGQIPEDAVMCTLCGRQVEQITQNQRQPNFTQSVQIQNTEVKEQKPKKKKKWWIILIVVVVFLIILGSMPTSDTDDDSTSVNNANATVNNDIVVEPSTPTYDYEITDIDAFFKEYEDNAVTADKKYNGKLIKITGRFKDAGKDILDNYYITVGGADDLSWDYFQCYFKNNSELEKVMNYKTGDSVTLIGKVGDQMLSITLDDCVLAE